MPNRLFDLLDRVFKYGTNIETKFTKRQCGIGYIIMAGIFFSLTALSANLLYM